MPRTNSVHSDVTAKSSSGSKTSSARLRPQRPSLKRGRKSVRERVQEPECLQLIKVTTLHTLLYASVVAYLFIGAGLFFWVEGGEEERRIAEKGRLLAEFDVAAQTFANDSRVLGCDILISNFLTTAAEKGVDVNDVLTLDGVKPKYKPDSDWKFSSSFLFAFTIVTSIGYGNIAPVTDWGKYITIVYAVIGIPFCMIAIADLGKFMVQAMAIAWRKFRGRNRSVNDADRAWLFPVLITLAFWVYILIGGALLPLWETDWDYGNAVYFCFITLTTIGLGDFVPNKLSFLPLTILYIATGLWLTTQTMEVFADVLKKVHYAGRKLTNIEDATIWIGGSKMKVRDIIRTVQREVGIPVGVMTDVDWDDAINNTIEEVQQVPPPSPTFERVTEEPVRTTQPETSPPVVQEQSLLVQTLPALLQTSAPSPAALSYVSAINVDPFPPAAPPKPTFSVHVKVKPTDARKKSYYYHYDTPE